MRKTDNKTDMNNKFTPLGKDKNISNSRKVNISKRRIIKSDYVKFNPSIKIGNDKPKITSCEDERIEPITKDGEIIGVIHKCVCGRIAKIFFEYEKPE